MDLRLGIVEGAYTPRVARILTRAIAVMTEEEAAGLLAEVGTAALSQATLSRIPRIIAARYELHREVIEPALRARDNIPDATVTLQVAFDGVDGATRWGRSAASRAEDRFAGPTTTRATLRRGRRPRAVRGGPYDRTRLA